MKRPDFLNSFVLGRYGCQMMPDTPRVKTPARTHQNQNGGHYSLRHGHRTSEQGFRNSRNAPAPSAALVHVTGYPSQSDGAALPQEPLPYDRDPQQEDVRHYIGCPARIAPRDCECRRVQDEMMALHTNDDEWEPDSQC